MDTLIFVNATIGFSENLFLVFLGEALWVYIQGIDHKRKLKFNSSNTYKQFFNILPVISENVGAF